MPEENIGTPADTSAAPGSDAGLSPTIDTDTSTGNGTDSGASGGTGGGNEELQALREEAEELRKRVAHGTRTAQENKELREKIQKHESRFETWRKHQVDPDEIDRAIAAATGSTGTTTQQPGKAFSAEDIERMVDQRVSMKSILTEWERGKDDWFDKNSDVDSKTARKFFDTAAQQIAQAELDEHGAVLSNPKQILKKVEKEWNALQTAIEKKAMARLTQTREKVNQQGIVESGHVKPKVDRSDSDDDKPETPQAWAARQNEQKERLRAGK